MQITDQKYVSYIEAKKILEKKTKEKELTYEQKNALEYLRKFCKLSEKKAEELYEKLEKHGKLKEKYIAMVVNMIPTTADELKILFSNEIINLSDADREEILKLVKGALD